MVDFSKHIKGGTVARETSNKPSDPFDDDWGMPEGQEHPATDEMPEAGGDDRSPFIKPRHVGNARTGTLELVRVTDRTSEYSDVILLVKFRGREFSLGLKLFSEDYKRLKAKFGPKKSDWAGKKLQYKVMAHGRNSDGYIGIRPA